MVSLKSRTSRAGTPNLSCGREGSDSISRSTQFTDASGKTTPALRVGVRLPTTSSSGSMRIAMCRRT